MIMTLFTCRFSERMYEGATTSPPVNEVIGRDQEDRLGLGTYLEDAYAPQIQEVASLDLRHADEHRVAGLAAYDCPHPMHVGGSPTNGIGGAATRTGGLDERHVKGEGHLQHTLRSEERRVGKECRS